MGVPNHKVRRACPEDRVAIEGVVRAAFDRDDEAKLVERLWTDEAFALEMVAEIDGEVVAYCGFTPVSIDGDESDGCFGLAPAAVAPTHQSKGLGAAVIKAGLNDLREQNAQLFVVLGEPNYYSRFGFEPASRYGLHWAVMDAGDAFQALLFDTTLPRSGARVHYHPAFSSI